MKRMKMMKKAAIWMLTASMAAGLTACGGSGAEAEDTGDISDPESVKGTITVGGWPSGDDAFKAALEGFHKEYPERGSELSSLQIRNCSSSGSADSTFRRFRRTGMWR